MDKASCPPPEQLEQFLLGQLPEPQAEGLGQHLSQCDPCVRTVEGLRVDDTLLEELHKGVGVARQAAQAVQQGLMERVQALAPSSKPPDLKDAPTPPPDNQWACQPTPGPVARAGLPAIPAGSFKFLAPAQAPDEIGRLGAYRVLEVLGKGGMGVVFRAEDVRLGRPVALKAMLPEVAQEPDARERFLREARAVAALEHDNIIAIHQVDEDRGVPYLVMPLLKGMSLEDRLKTKQSGGGGTSLGLALILKIGREIATGLAVAHKRGLIHRDIKPGNIWLDATAGGRVKLLDFGLARSTTGDQKLTQSGCILGTPAYMAPEQAQGHKVDGRADLFSLGVVLYQLCTGELPFHGPDMYSLLMALATHEPPPPQALNPGLPGRLSDLVMKLLPKDPARRLGSAQEAVKELLAIEKDLAPAPPAADLPVAEAPAAPPQPGVAAPARVSLDPTKVAGPTRRRRRRWPLVAACVALVVVPLGIYLAPTIIRVDTNEGTLVIDLNDPDVLVTVKQDNVKLYDKVKDRTFTVTAGKGVVEVYEKDGVGLIKTEKFTLNRNGTETVHVRLERRIARVVPKQPGPTEKLTGKTTGGEKPPAAPATKPSGGGEKPPAMHAEKAAVLFSTNMAKSIFKGHTKDVISLAFSPDGKRLASASDDGTLKVWDVPTGQCVLTIKVECLTSVAFSPDGKRLASGSMHGTEVWDVTTGQKTLTLTGHTSNVASVAFSRDGKRMASGSKDGTVKVWDSQTGKERLTLRGHTGGVLSVAFSPDGKHLASSSGGTWDEQSKRSKNGQVKVWDAQTGEATLTLWVFKGKEFSSVAYSPDGKRLVSCVDLSLKAWDATTGKETLTIPSERCHVLSVAFSPDGKRLVGGNADNTVQAWDATTGKETLRLRGHTAAVSSVAFGPDGKCLASGSRDGTVRLWDTAPSTNNVWVSTLRSGFGAVDSVAFSPDGKRVASGDFFGEVKVWDAKTGQGTLTLKGHTNQVTSVAFSRDGKRLASGSWDHTAIVWDAQTGQDVLTLQGHTEVVRCVAFSPDGKRLASCSGDSTVKVWDASTGKEILTLRDPRGWITSVTFSPDGKRLASSSRDGPPKLWDATTGKETLTLKTNIGGYSLAFSPNGKRLVSGNSSSYSFSYGSVTVWDTATGERTDMLHGHEYWVASVAFSPDGKHVASGGHDRTVKVWDAMTGEEILTLGGHTGEITSVAFGPDGKRLVSGSKDGTVSLWYLDR